MKILRWLFTLPLAIILVLFAIDNRELVEVSLWPLEPVIRWPLFVYVYIGTFVGFAAGAAVAWVSTTRHRRRSRQRRQDREERREARRTERPAPPAPARPAALDAAPQPPALTR